jgi:c-di-GMP-binding flagellar brake protein YcgR
MTKHLQLRRCLPLDSVIGMTPPNENSLNSANDFTPVSFDKDRELAFEGLANKAVLVTGWVASSRPLFFHVQRVDVMTVNLTIVDGDGLSAATGDSVELLFSLDDGQYHWRTKIHIASAHEWSLAKGGELSRLQRRNNFRTNVPKGYKANLVMKSFKTHTISRTELQLVDVSAGGARVRWPAGLSMPAQGDSLAGVLSEAGGRQIEVFGIIKSVLTDVDTGATQAGLEFQNLSGRDEQALLHLCLQIRRTQAPVLK